MNLNAVKEKKSEEDVEVSFEKVTDNVGKVTAIRNGESFSIELFSLTESEIDEIKKIRQQLNESLATLRAAI